ncbi:MAG: hypothetical protein IKN11_05650 [Bacteroidales bacterium]|nr:hypothetical protein [Bacteroidales bacterium]
MKNRLFILIFLVAGVGSLWGQSFICEAPAVATDTSIVRWWKAQKYVVYSRQGSNPATVSLVDFASGMVKTATLPSGATINDFRIDGNKVIAGGSNMSGSQKVGLLACVDILDLEAGSGSFHVCSFSNTWTDDGCCAVDYFNRITDVKRIAIVKGGVSEVAFIADNVILDSDGETVLFNRVGYGSAAIPPVSGNIFEYHYNKYGMEEYTDIDTMENYIVIAAKATDSSTLRLQVFDKTHDFARCKYYSYTTDRYCHNDHVLMGNPMVSALDGDNFAVVYHTKPNLVGNSIMVVKKYSVSGGAPSLTGSLDVSISSGYLSNWKMRDVKYCSYYHTLMALNDCPAQSTPGFGSHVYLFDMLNFNSGPHQIRFLPYHYSEYSLDMSRNDGYVLSGQMNAVGQLVVSEELIPAPSSCGQREILPKFTPSTPSMYRVSRYQCTVVPVVSDIVIPFVAVESMLNNTCSRQTPYAE